MYYLIMFYLYTELDNMRCLACDGVIHPRDCNRAKLCDADEVNITLLVYFVL